MPYSYEMDEIVIRDPKVFLYTAVSMCVIYGYFIYMYIYI